MTETRVAALCYALMDEKVFDNQSPLPEATVPAAEAFLAAQPQSNRVQEAGGSLVNTLLALEQFGDCSVRGYYSVGNDARGRLYTQQTGYALGKPQIVDNDHTGFCILEVGDNGETVDKRVLFGAAKSVTIPPDERSDRHDLVLSNVNTLCGNPHALEQTTSMLESQKPNGLFAFRLSGADSLLASGEAAREVLDSLPKDPDIVFGNTDEITNILDNSDRLEALRQILPNSRALILTSKSDIMVRFEDEFFRQPTPLINEAVDVTGAGDQLMGMVLAHLLRRESSTWKADDLKKALLMGSTTASLLVMERNSRLDKDSHEKVHRILGLAADWAVSRKWMDDKIRT